MSDTVLQNFLPNAPESGWKVLWYILSIVVASAPAWWPIARKFVRYVLKFSFAEEIAKQEFKDIVNEQKSIVDRQEQIMKELSDISQKQALIIQSNENSMKQLTDIQNRLHKDEESISSIKERLSFIEGTLQKKK